MSFWTFLQPIEYFVSQKSELKIQFWRNKFHLHGIECVSNILYIWNIWNKKIEAVYFWPRNGFFLALKHMFLASKGMFLTSKCTFLALKCTFLALKCFLLLVWLVLQSLNYSILMQYKNTEYGKKCVPNFAKIRKSEYSAFRRA